MAIRDRGTRVCILSREGAMSILFLRACIED